MNVKIMVMDAALRNQDRFLGRQTLSLTGERYEESTNRQTYDVVEPHRTDLRNGGAAARRSLATDPPMARGRGPEAH